MFVYPLPITIYSTLRAQNQKLCKSKKGGIRLSKTQIIETVIKIASMLITVVLTVIKAIGLFGESAEAAA